MQGATGKKQDPLITVIVPVYKVEAYLEECLDSVLRQTWKNLDVILVDDGSPDACGAICESYAEKDSRVRVFHTENRGLSAARNLGITKAEETESEYLIFVDSDDWLEANMIEKLAAAAMTTEADIVMCGMFCDYPGKRISDKLKQAVCTGTDAVKAIMSGQMYTKVMNRIWKKKLFNRIRFPEGRVYEDVATTYRLYLNSGVTAVIPDVLYHYRVRSDSIAHTQNIPNSFDLWLALKERYECSCQHLSFKDDKSLQKACRKLCLGAACRLWRIFYDSPKATREKYRQNFQEISDYVKETFSVFGEKGWPLRFRVYSLLTRSTSPISFSIAYVLNKTWLLLKGRNRQKLFGEEAL